MTLTEQWKKGELPSGWYYVEGNRVEGIYAYVAEYLNNMYRPRNSERIIAKVPSYDEYLSLTYAKEEDEGIIAEYEAENTKLKELLKEWARFETEENPNDFTVISERMSELANKTNQALGKDK